MGSLINWFYTKKMVLETPDFPQWILCFITLSEKDMSHFAYACKTEGKNDISRLISETA